MKRIISLLLALVMLTTAALSLSSCGDSGASNGGDVNPGGDDNGGGDNGGGDEGGGTEDGGNKTESLIDSAAYKILVVGDASSASAVEYVDDVLISAGKEKVAIATLNCNFNTGASIEDQYKNIQNSKKTYTFAIKQNGEILKTYYSQKFDDALAYDAWDVIVIQQAVPKAGIASEYSNLDYIVNYISDNKTNPDASIYWNMTWAYNKDSSHAGFGSYGNDQNEMYSLIVNNLKTFVDTNDKIDGVFPVGAAIQNLRQTFLDGSVTGTVGIQLDTQVGAYITALVWARCLLGSDEASLSLSDDTVNAYSRIIGEAIDGALTDRYAITTPFVKSFKILSFGNSYSNDAIKWLDKIFKSAGYDVVVIGTATDGGCNINHHWSNVDDTLEDYHPGDKYAGMTGIEGTAGTYYMVDGKTVQASGDTLKERYKNLISAMDWDYVTIQHGPNDVEKLDTYSHLGDLLEFIEDNLTSDKTKFIYHMIWKYNDTLAQSQRTSYHYNNILNITQNYVLQYEQFDGVIPAATFRQNMTSSFLDDVDISRDYGHMGWTLGRYALGLLWYCYLTGGSVDDVTYRPSSADVSAQDKATSKAEYGHVHLDITDEDILVIKEAIKNAIEKPYEITQSVYTSKP